MQEFNSAKAQSQVQQRDLFPPLAPPTPSPVEWVTVEKAEWERVNRLLKFCRGDRKRQAQCIAELKGDCDKLYAKLKAAGGEL